MKIMEKNIGNILELIEICKLSFIENDNSLKSTNYTIYKDYGELDFIKYKTYELCKYSI